MAYLGDKGETSRVDITGFAVRGFERERIANRGSESGHGEAGARWGGAGFGAKVECLGCAGAAVYPTAIF
ncbi:hypothetical protein G7K_4723-t1 [Saitoella complicata NRRL Y-17804]|uniref:Uncharacterized protein n=1 Tax=Saitoella complicata (strain BCRC 22490 / CBS 7301 / JCM 7358 / NBRC 10748 / NRRL Y-17804) TaxID=698492 RepID=A0A0E9NL76_SAICN|nr:hypothetical protein G7K_4723-t1 [Saitoella complicata NRRL Y-17804]